MCVPTSQHAPVALDVIGKGIDLLVEKPLAGSVEEARTIVEAADQAGITLPVGHVGGPNPVVAVGKRGLAAGGGRAPYT